MVVKLRQIRSRNSVDLAVDATIIYDIRYDPMVKELFQSAWVSWVDHVNWFRKNHQQFQIITDRGEAIGYVRTQPGGYIGIGINNSCRSRGIATKILKEIKGRAIIMMENKASLSAFKKAGWTLKGYYLEKEE